ncbi:MAG: alpha/beta hydrolase [Pseudomonadales bacterium]|nr:alpha/beta hydrolase [Pseudomonadales bacterium]
MFFALTPLVLVSGCLALSGEYESRFADIDSIGERIVCFNAVDLHIVDGGNPAGQPVVFFRGTPGSAEFFASYLLHPDLQDLRLMSLDRPGWGTSLARNQFDGTFAAQSAMLGEFLCGIKSANLSQQLLIVAHSYGATLTPLLVMDYQQCISAVLLLAGAADPDLAAPRW